MNRPDYANWPAQMLREMFDGIVAEAADAIPAPSNFLDLPEPMRGEMGALPQTEAA